MSNFLEEDKEFEVWEAYINQCPACGYNHGRMDFVKKEDRMVALCPHTLRILKLVPEEE
jgi:hypothetical protein